MFINANGYLLDLAISIMPIKKKSKMSCKTKGRVFKNDWFSGDYEKTKITIWILDNLKITLGISLDYSNFYSWFDHLIKIAARNNLMPRK